MHISLGIGHLSPPTMHFCGSNDEEYFTYCCYKCAEVALEIILMAGLSFLVAENFIEFIVLFALTGGILLISSLIDCICGEIWPHYETENTETPQERNTENRFEEVVIGRRRTDIPSPNYAGYNLPENTRIDPRHFQEIVDLENNIPDPPADTQLNDLFTLFNGINFTENQHREDYVNPNAIADDNVVISKDQVLQKLRRWIYRIQNRTGEADVPSSYQEKEKYYANLEKLLKHIVFKLNAVQSDLVDRYLDPNNAQEACLISQRQKQIEAVNKRSQVLLRLGVGMNHCAGRVMSEAIECYEELHNLGNSFENHVKQRLHMLRRGIIAEIAREADPRGGSFHAHYVLNLIEQLGTSRGVLGGTITGYDDPYARNINTNVAYYKFDSKYTRDKLVAFVKEAIDGISSSSGRVYRTLDLSECTQWFRDHVSADWQNRPLQNGYADHAEQFINEFAFDSNYMIRDEAVVYMLKEMHVILD